MLVRIRGKKIIDLEKIVTLHLYNFKDVKLGFELQECLRKSTGKQNKSNDCITLCNIFSTFELYKIANGQNSLQGIGNLF